MDGALVLHNARYSSAKPDNSMMETAREMHWVSSAILAPLFLALGLVGNTLSILVWTRKPMRSSTGNYLIAQAVADSGLLVFFVVTDSIVMIDPGIKTMYAYGVFYSYIGYPIFFLFIVLSIWLTVGVTVDRYIHVCWAIHAKRMVSSRKALTGIGIITILCFIINIPHFLTFHPVPLSERNESDPAFEHTEFGTGEGSKHYEFWVHCMFVVLVPWITIFCLNMLIINRISKTNKVMASKRGGESNEKARRFENQLTRLLLTVTFTFLVLLALQCVSQCFFMLQPPEVDMNVVNEAFAIGKLGVVINSSINFFLYCLSGSRFRTELSKMVAAKCGNIKILISDSSTRSFTKSSSTNYSTFSGNSE